MPKSMRVVEALERVARRLQQEKGDQPLRRRDLEKAVARDCGCAEKSVLPSDHCYDRTNDGISPDLPAMFLHCGRGLYRFVGRDYPYSGPQMHYPQGGKPRQVAVWVNGVRTDTAG